MARSLKKGPYVEAKLDAKVAAMIEGKSKKGVIKTWSRRSTITTTVSPFLMLNFGLNLVLIFY